MEDLIKEIEEMENLLTAQTNPPSTDAPTTDAPALATDAPTTDSPATDSPATDSPATDSPTTSAPSELDQLRNDVKELRALLTKGKDQKSPATSAPTTAAPLGDLDFLEGTDLDELTRDPDQFNKLLNKVFKKGVEAARGEVRLGSEGILRTIPDVVKNNIHIVSVLKKASDEFYSTNADLKPFKKVVANVFEELASENPDKNYRDLLVDVEKETRKRLELHKKAVAGDDKPPRPPKAKGGHRGPQTKPSTDPLLAEIEEMDNYLDT